MADKFAIVTGASSGIGYELADICASEGYDLLVAADSPGIEQAAETFRSRGAAVTALEVDLSTDEGVERLYELHMGGPWTRCSPTPVMVWAKHSSIRILPMSVT